MACWHNVMRDHHLLSLTTVSAETITVSTKTISVSAKTISVSIKTIFVSTKTVSVSTKTVSVSTKTSVSVRRSSSPRIENSPIQPIFKAVQGWGSL